MSDYVIMPRADYEAACNSIRLKTGKMDLIKSGDMSAEIESITDSGTSADVRYVTFMSYDGSVEYIKLPVAVGYDCPNPKIDDPTRESDVQYNYTFAGWATTPNGGLDSNALKAVEEDRTVYANFAAVVRYYTITYLDTDGSVLKTESLPHGRTPSYAPVKTGYTFDGWTPAVEAVTEDATYTAKWIAKMDISTMSWSQIKSYAESGEAADKFELGDTKSFTYKFYNGSAGWTQTTAVAKIVGFNHDDLADGSGKAGITFQCSNFQRAGSIHATGTAERNAKYWGESDCRTNVHSFLTNSSAAFPSDLTAAMKTVVKKYYKDGSYLTSEDKVFLPSVSELGFVLSGREGEGECYAAFTPNKATTDIDENLRVVQDSTYVDRWTRTKDSASSGTYYCIKSTGALSTGNQGSEKSRNMFFCI